MNATTDTPDDTATDAAHDTVRKAMTRDAPGGPAIHEAIVDSPIGPLRIAASDRGVRSIDWTTDGADEPRDTIGTIASSPEPDDVAAREVVEGACRQLAEYFAGERTAFDVPLDPLGTDFQRQAWVALRGIPYGETVTYREQAERLGDARKARAVGAANGRNPIPIIVPCHRVIGSNGSLTGFAGGIEAKRWLLDHERRVSGTTLL